MISQTATDMRRISASESELIVDFESHPVLRNFDVLNERTVHSVLLQRRFMSLAFTPLYDIAIDGLTDPVSKQVARDIVREEYACPAATHREDLVSDLLSIGIPQDAILKTLPTPVTLETLRDFFLTLPNDGTPAIRDVHLLTVLRFGAEILVAVEYSRFWPRLQSLGLSQDAASAANFGGKVSVFYYSHMHHDAGTFAIDDVAAITNLPPSHADRLATCLERSLKTSGTDGIEQCLSTMGLCLRIKKRFYDQFDAR